jgi:hypothetical protein
MVGPAEKTGLSGRTAKPNVVIMASAIIHLFLDFIVFLSVKGSEQIFRLPPSLGLLNALEESHVSGIASVTPEY